MLDGIMQQDSSYDSIRPSPLERGYNKINILVSVVRISSHLRSYDISTKKTPKLIDIKVYIFKVHQHLNYCYKCIVYEYNMQ